MDKYLDFKNKYDEFIYDSYSYFYTKDKFIISYKFIIKNLKEFNPTIKINKSIITNQNIDDNFLSYLVFHIGLVEMISYYKVTCSPKIIINAGFLNEEQINWFKKLIFNGLGEFFYKNNIKVDQNDFVNIIINKEKSSYNLVSYNGSGNLIPIGGGKDSCVSLEILKNEKNMCFMINPKEPQILSAKAAGYDESDIITIERDIEKDKLIELNNMGFLNGHIPFSSVVAFISYLCAYLSNKENIVLSNESSSNEETVIGTNINHQYSKSLQFENDFRYYTKKYFTDKINYFSLLRGLSEYQISYLFSKFEKYHSVFKSCNLGSKNETWKWCLNCPKCLFVFTILSPFLYKHKLVNIFGEDLFEREDLIDTFKEMIGESNVKPFECVGTINEAKYAISKTITNFKSDNLPFLLKYFKDNYELFLDGDDILAYNEENNVPDEYNQIIKDLIKGD